tara:strand:- start:6281 stop:6781 length:501 start_codon:yes stop_codon:yes gene_type:complete
MIDNIFEIMDCGVVKRYHTLETIGEQSIASHSWGVAIILEYLKPDVSKDLIMKALTHDVTEAYTGDMPSPLKWAHPEVKKVLDKVEEKYEELLGVDQYSIISAEEKILYKQADMFELLFFCMKQRRMGNTNMNKVFSKGVEFLASQKLNDRGSRLLGQLIKLYGGI